MLHLHLDTPQPRLADAQPLFLPLRTHDLFREEPCRFDVTLCGELFQLLTGFGCCDVELPERFGMSAVVEGGKKGQKRE
jgi:hypothetical protein